MACTYMPLIASYIGMRVRVTHTYVISMASRHNCIAIDGCHNGIAMVGVCAHVAMYYRFLPPVE